jgi:hypothetical protein
MPIDDIEGNQVINRYARINTTYYGFIDVITMGDLPNVFSTTTLPTGQVRSTGQKQNADVQCSVMLSNRTDVAKVEMWHQKSERGQGAGTAASYVDKGGSFQIYHEDQTPGPLVEVEEMFPHTLTYPGTDVSNEGEGAQFLFTLTIRGARRVLGT